MRIVVFYSDSPEGEVALQRAEREARLRDASVVLVRYVGVGNSAEDDRFRRSQAVLDAAVASLTAAGIAAEGRFELGPQSAGATVLRVANEVDADLIVIGTRRRTPMGKLVMGSSSQEILLHADCPVLAVKAPREEEH